MSTSKFIPRAANRHLSVIFNPSASLIMAAGRLQNENSQRAPMYVEHALQAMWRELVNRMDHEQRRHGYNEHFLIRHSEDGDFDPNSEGCHLYIYKRHGAYELLQQQKYSPHTNPFGRDPEQLTVEQRLADVIQNYCASLIPSRSFAKDQQAVMVQDFAPFWA